MKIFQRHFALIFDAILFACNTEPNLKKIMKIGAKREQKIINQMNTTFNVNLI